MTIFRDKTRAEAEAKKRTKNEKVWCVYPYGSAFVVDLKRPELKKKERSHVDAQLVLAALVLAKRY